MMNIIPAIDCIDGQVVRLEQGDFNKQTNYQTSLLDMAKRYEDGGFKHIHIINLSGTLNPQDSILPIIAQIKSETNLSLQVGGGIRRISDAVAFAELGVDKLIVSSSVVEHIQEVEAMMKATPKARYIAALDCLDLTIRTRGWKVDSGINVFDFIPNVQAIGIQEFLITDIAKDGLLSGPSIELYKRLLAETSIELIASGGVSNLADIKDLDKMGCHSVVVGKAIYEGRISLDDLVEYSNV
jgi:phosphoribosylformimino-5-aminoimidazole carboxamide ribotide isomerase